jgi:D-sedoheptulose 7-phosphate isomerase
MTPLAPADGAAARHYTRQHLRNAAAAQELVISQCLEPIVEVANTIAEAFRDGHKVLLCGNGGSAADCQHMAAEFVSRLDRDFDRPPLPALALTTDTSFLTGFSNDCGYEGVFERQVCAFGAAGDVLILISTSGNSANLKPAIRAARERGVLTVGLFGRGGLVRGEVDSLIEIPAQDTQTIQECMLPIEHVICALVEKSLFIPTGAGSAG